MTAADPTPPHRARRTGPALEKWYGFLQWLLPAVQKLPRNYKFTLGDRMLTMGLEVLERLIEATYQRHATPALQAANLELEKLRFVLRMVFDLRLFDVRRYEYAARAIDETGRLIGGWLRVAQVRKQDGDMGRAGHA